MLLREPWLLVFDLDGTLIDSSLDLCLAVNAAMAHVGSPQLPHELITNYIGDGAAMLVRRALGGSDDVSGTASDQEAERDRFERAFGYFLDFYREHKLDNTRLYDGVSEALTAIRRCRPNLPMAVLTNKPVNPSREICRAVGLEPYFFANYGGNSFATKKPDPEGLQYLMGEAKALHSTKGVSTGVLGSGNVVMIGDSAADILAARNAGVRSLGCRYGLAPQSLETAGPDLMCDHPTEWPDLLGISC